MHFAWPAAAGLGVGMLAGFVVALVRPRPPAPSRSPAAAPATGTTPATRPRPPRRVIDATTPDARVGSEAGSDISGRVI
jgi:hypothetical protein